MYIPTFSSWNKSSSILEQSDNFRYASGGTPEKCGMHTSYIGLKVGNNHHCFIINEKGRIVKLAGNQLTDDQKRRFEKGHEKNTNNGNFKKFSDSYDPRW